MASTVLPPRPDGASTAEAEPRQVTTTRSGSDRIFRGGVSASGIAVLVIMALVGIFLTLRALQALSQAGLSFITTQAWEPDGGNFGIAAVLTGTVLIALTAIFFAVPLSTGVALYISEYSPRKIKQTLVSLVDLMAAVPSVVFGLWGFFFLQGQIIGIARWISTYFGWIPIFANSQEIWTKSILMAGLVLAIMVLPTVSAISREVFVQVPRMHVEAALALGATRWEMIRMAVFPFSRPGMISAAMLGLGRALGETIAVALILSAVFEINWAITEPGGNTFAANIALKWGEAGETGRSALIASGLVLFFITLVVNMAARWVISRRKEFSGAN